MHRTLETTALDNLLLFSTCGPKRLIFWVLRCPHCKLLFDITSSKFPLLSLLDHFYIHSLMVGKIDATDASAPASYFLLPSQAMKRFAFLMLLELLSEQVERKWSSKAGVAAAASCLPRRGPKQPSVSTAHLQKAKQVGRTKCCCSVTYFLVFPHAKEPAKNYDGYVYRWCTSLETRTRFSLLSSPCQHNFQCSLNLNPGMDIWITSGGEQNRLIVRLLVRTHQGKLLSQSLLSKPLSVGIVLAQCPGETLEITETLSLSAMMMATLKSLGSPWPHWWVYCRCYQTRWILWVALESAKLSSLLKNHHDSTYSVR